MLRWFTPVPTYLRIYKDRMVLRRVDTGGSIDRISSVPFTSDRLLVGDFPAASELLNGMLRDVNDRVGIFSRNLQLVIQPMEMMENGLSSVERRAFLDLGEHAGAKPVILADSRVELNDAQILDLLLERQ